MGGAGASHCVRLQIPGGGDTAAQLCGVTEDVISTGRVESAVVYCEDELDASAMALSGLSHHAPVSVERRGNCGRSGTAAARVMAQIRLPIMGVLPLPALKAAAWRRLADTDERRRLARSWAYRVSYATTCSEYRTKEKGLPGSCVATRSQQGRQIATGFSGEGDGEPAALV